MNKKDPTAIITQIETLLQELKLSIEAGNGNVVVAGPRKPEGLTGNLHDLINEGFFDQSRTLSDIHKKLRVEGINKPVTSLMKPLLYLIKNRILKREKPDKGQYQYQRR